MTFALDCAPQWKRRVLLSFDPHFRPQSADGTSGGFRQHAAGLLANRLLGWLGAAAVILALPVLYTGTFGLLLASASFTTLVAVRAGVMVWLQGVTSPA